MIQLRSDCLAFQNDTGESIPCSAEKITLQIIKSDGAELDSDIVEHAIAAVLHYFREELGRDQVSMGEFTMALERVLRGFGLTVKSAQSQEPGPAPSVEEADLRTLACEAGKGFELTFFPRLRSELERKLQLAPQVIRFTGLRSCVKQLTGAQRWSGRCQQLNDQIVDFARLCLRSGIHGSACAMVVE